MINIDRQKPIFGKGFLRNEILIDSQSK